jgi:hypothetical protein
MGLKGRTLASLVKSGANASAVANPVYQQRLQGLNNIAWQGTACHSSKGTVEASGAKVTKLMLTVSGRSTTSKIVLAIGIPNAKPLVTIETSSSEPLG